MVDLFSFFFCVCVEVIPGNAQEQLPALYSSVIPGDASENIWWSLNLQFLHAKQNFPVLRVLSLALNLFSTVLIMC